MSITASNLASAANTTDAASFSTASITPAASQLVLIYIFYGVSAGTPVAPTTVSGCGITWTHVATSAVVLRKRVSLYKGYATSGITTGAITFDFNAVTQQACQWLVIQYNGADDVTQAVAANTASSAATSHSISLAAFASASNATAGFFSVDNNGLTYTPGTGFTIVSGATNGAPTMQSTNEFQAANDTSVDVTWGTGSGQGFGIAAELHSSVTTTTTDITKSLKYTIKRTPTALTKSTKYTIIKSLSLTKSLRYTIKKPVAITKSLAYAIKHATALTKSFAISG
jgi:hypothetical protein